MRDAAQQACYIALCGDGGRWGGHAVSHSGPGLPQHAFQQEQRLEPARVLHNSKRNSFKQLLAFAK